MQALLGIVSWCRARGQIHEQLPVPKTLVHAMERPASGQDTKVIPLSTSLQMVSALVQLADGADVILRPVDSSDREHFRIGFHSMSPRSRYRRFFSYSPGLSDAQLRYLTKVDQTNHVAWVAVTAETPVAGVGVARFVRIPEHPAIAEFSFAVIDALQRKGLGRALLAMLHLLAVESRVEILRAVCLPDNYSVVSWLCRLGAESRYYAEGTIELDLHVRRSFDMARSCGGTAGRFASVLHYLGRATGGARENLRSPETSRE